MANRRCVVGYFFEPGHLLEATRRVRDRKFNKFDTFSPFPIHGMDEAMGLKRSCLPYFAFIFGCLGMGGGAFLTIWTHLYSWPINVGGKPLLALPAYIPVIFETTILACGVLTTLTMFTLFLGLPNYKKRIFHPDLTSHRFAIAIEVEKEEEVEPVKQFLRELQAQEVETFEGEL